MAAARRAGLSLPAARVSHNHHDCSSVSLVLVVHTRTACSDDVCVGLGGQQRLGQFA
jgi:hypothetical protein